MNSPRDFDASTTGLIRELAESSRDLLSKEIQLARTEVLEGFERSRRALMWFGAALVPALVALVLVALSIAHLLGLVLPLWAAALVPAGGLLLVAAALGYLGVVRMSSAADKLKPRRAARNLKQDQELIRAQLSGLKESLTR